MTNLEFTSRVRNQLNSLNKDDYISNRFILFTGQSIAKSYLAKKLKDRKLYRNSSLYTTIPCFEMKSVNSFECDVVEFKNCNKLMKSVNKLPELLHTSYGSSLKTVSPIDNSVFFDKSTLAAFKRNSQREIVGKEPIYFYELDGYLYLTGTSIEIVNLYVLTQDLYDANELCGCSENNCQSAWDYPFVINDDLIENVIRETVQQVMVNVQIVEDEKPNLDSNIKSQTI